MISLSDRDWPNEGLEQIDACPFCNSSRRTVAYREVKDWTFDSAPGHWTYWDCADCDSLYLDPRPTLDSIGLAYKKYYTHGAVEKRSPLQGLKNRLINECWSHWLATDLKPRLEIPRNIAWPLRLLHSKIPPPFELEFMAKSPRGLLMDVGCGDGSTIKLAAKLGWKVTGLELDANAVQTARANGLDVLEGTYKNLEWYQEAFDYVICSHLIEHVHQPHLLLQLIKASLKPGGVALISCPNSQSYVRQIFGSSWRGLEAPRHLAIPSLDYLTNAITRLGFAVAQINPVGSTTKKQSRRIAEARKKSGDIFEDYKKDGATSKNNHSHPDLIQLACRKLPAGASQPEQGK